MIPISENFPPCDHTISHTPVYDRDGNLLIRACSTCGALLYPEDAVIVPKAVIDAFCWLYAETGDIDLFSDAWQERVKANQAIVKEWFDAR